MSGSFRQQDFAHKHLDGWQPYKFDFIADLKDFATVAVGSSRLGIGIEISTRELEVPISILGSHPSQNTASPIENVEKDGSMRVWHSDVELSTQHIDVFQAATRA